MLYAVRSKPESLLYYPVFKLIFQEGWTGMPTDAFKDLILSQIQSIQSQIAEEQGLTVNENASRRHGVGHDQPGAARGDILANLEGQSESDMPLASKESIALDSHRPLTYETHTLKQTEASEPPEPQPSSKPVKRFTVGDTEDDLDRQEDRIRTI